MKTATDKAKALRLKREKSTGRVKSLWLASKFERIDEDETRGQIGEFMLGVINGGRTEMLTPATMRLPMRYGYAVEIWLEADDTYTVRRTFTRAGIRTEKGTQEDVYFMELGEVAYQASCWRNRPFGREI